MDLADKTTRNSPYFVDGRAIYCRAHSVGPTVKSVRSTCISPTICVLLYRVLLAASQEMQLFSPASRINAAQLLSASHSSCMTPATPETPPRCPQPHTCGSMAWPSDCMRLSAVRVGAEAANHRRTWGDMFVVFARSVRATWTVGGMHHAYCSGSPPVILGGALF